MCLAVYFDCERNSVRDVLDFGRCVFAHSQRWNWRKLEQGLYLDLRLVGAQVCFALSVDLIEWWQWVFASVLVGEEIEVHNQGQRAVLMGARAFPSISRAGIRQKMRMARRT